MTMKKFVLISGLAVIFAGTFLDPNPVMAADAKNKTAVKAATKTKLKVKKIRHVVCFKFKEDATEAQIKKVEKAFAGLKKKIPEIKGLEWGVNNSPGQPRHRFPWCRPVLCETCRQSIDSMQEL